MSDIPETIELRRFNQLVVDLNVQWQMYRDLFEGPANYKIFNESGATFWMYLRSYLLDLLFMSVSRFFDPKKSCGQDNLSLQAVIALGAVQGMRPKLQKRFDAMKPVWDRGIRMWRHKRLSHYDMSTALGACALPDIPIGELKQLVSDISEFAEAIELQLGGGGVCHEVGIQSWVPVMLERLRAGVALHRRKLSESEDSR